MGTDKRRAMFDGVPLLRRAVALADTLSDDVMVVMAEDQPIPNDLLDGLRWRAMHDTRRDHGPLGGLEAALLSAQFDCLLAIPTDMPRLTTPLLGLLAASLRARPEDCVALMKDGEPQPFPIGFQRRALKAVAGLLDAEVRSMRSLLGALSVWKVAEIDWRRLDPEGVALVNINTPGDLGRG
jgi:molybdopterin-guanine dinucleotide biosynthesis protein A